MSNIAYELFASRLKESMNQQQMKPIDLLHLAEEQNLKLGKKPHQPVCQRQNHAPALRSCSFLQMPSRLMQTGWQDAPVLHRISVQKKLNSGGTKLLTEFNFCPHPDTVNGFLRRRFSSIFCILQTFRFGSEEIFFPSGRFRLFRSVCFPADAV